jgi:predicted dehydrogenase
MNSVRWGLLSTANINKALIPVIRKSPRSELAAVASRSLEKAQSYAEEWKIPFAYGSYQEMLSSGEVDAVYIGLPNHLHAEWTIKALDSGVNVLCEKPFATSLEQTDAMINASRSNDRALAEAFMYRHHPQTTLVKSWIEENKLGDITVIRGAFHFHLPDHQRQPENLNVRLVPEYGGGCLWDVGIYPLSYFQFLLDGPPHWVFGSAHEGPTGVDEVFAAQMGYRTETGTEVLGQFTSSFITPLHTFLEIVGTQGSLYITRPFTNLDKGADIVFTGKKGKKQNIRIPKKDLYLGEVEDLEKTIIAGKAPLISLAETRNHVKTALALYQSAREKQIVKLDQSVNY